MKIITIYFRMTKSLRVLIFIALTLFTFCCNFSPRAKTKDTIQEIDTLKAIKIGKFWATPKLTFEFHSLDKCSDDSLKLVTCSEYAYSPFGQLENKLDLAQSILKNFKVINKIEKFDNGKFEFQILTLKSSRLILFFDEDPEASKHSYIFKGEITDIETNLIDGIKIGMTKEDFFRTFFENFQNELLMKYNFIVFESCVDDMEHTYSFKDNKLVSISFLSDSYWHVDY
jgi:hypothetical protein